MDIRKGSNVPGGVDWDHIIPNVAAALDDATVFENPGEFKNRGIRKYHEAMMKTGDIENAGMAWVSCDCQERERRVDRCSTLSQLPCAGSLSPYESLYP